MKEYSIITIGTFDGLHKGHQHLISNLIDLSNQLKLKPIILTLPMPAKFYIDRENFLGCLTTTFEKIQLLKNWVKDVHILNFEEIQNMEPEIFIEKYLIKRFSMKAIIVGYDFKFGKGRKGDFNFLKSYCNNEYEIYKSNEYRINSSIVSSSKIRSLIMNGNIKEANFLLGRNYFINGVVIKGIQLARKIGFPTANVKFEPYKILPPDGVYSVTTVIDGINYNSIGYISSRNNNDKFSKNLEVHIFDFNKNIYSKPISVIFKSFVRSPMKFLSLEDARIQIKKDIIKIKSELN